MNKNQTTHSASDDSLRAENAELRARLAAAEEMLRVIRAAEVPVLVVEGDEGRRLLALKEGRAAEQLRGRGEMIAHVSDAVVAVDMEGRITFLNAGAERLYGVHSGEMLGRKLTDVFARHWPSPEEETAAWAGLREKGAWQAQYLQRTHQGLEVHVDYSFTALRDAHGEIIGFLGVIRDITERKQSEAALREQLNLTKSITDNANTSLFILNEKQHCVFMNPAAEQLTGFNFAEVSARGGALHEIVHHTRPDGSPYPLCECPIDQAFPTENKMQGEEVFVHKDGHFYDVAFTASPLRDPSGKTVGTVIEVQDITERQQAEAAQRLASERLTLSVKCSQVVLWQQDSELRYTWLQNAAAGFEEPVAIGKRDADLMERAEDAAVAEALKREVMRSGVSQRQEVLVQIAGVVRHYDLLVEPQRDAAGIISGVTCAAIDITERKRAEQALAERTELLNGVLASTTDVIFVKNLNGRLMLANPAFAAAARSTPEQLVGKTDSDWFPPDVAAAVRQQDEAVIAGGSPMQFEDTLPVAGKARVFLTLKAPLRDGGGRVVGVLGISRDITERKAAEEAVARLAAIVECSYDALLSEDLDGIVTSWNRGAEQIFGYRAEEIVGTSILRLIPEVGHAAEHDLQRQIVTGERGGTFEGVRRAKDGREFHASITVSPMTDAAGKIIGTSRVIRDITERKLAADSLREASEKAVAANAAKDRFLAVLSHELRTPLTPVLMTVAALEHDPDLRRDVREDMAMIRANIELETKLIDDLLDVSRVASGKLELRIERLELNAVVLHVCAMCRPQLYEQGVELSLDLCKEVGAIQADDARLEQVIWNVLKNAVKFTPRGGEIHLSSKRLTDARVEVRVTDNGVGIHAEVLPRIFDAFEQGDARITRHFGGLGLGLAISKALIELHGGTIRAESRGEGQGATFVIELPGTLTETPVTEPSCEPHAAEGGPTPAVRLLVVEDHRDTARALKTLLSLEGFTVTTAETVASALALGKTETFDILISDLGLPDASGHELMTRIQEIQPLRGIAMSGYGMEGDVRESLAAGFSEHLVKPVKIPQLVEAIRRVSTAKKGKPFGVPPT